MPDHPAASWPVGKSVAVALKIEKPDDLASVLSQSAERGKDRYEKPAIELARGTPSLLSTSPRAYAFGK